MKTPVARYFLLIFVLWFLTLVSAQQPNNAPLCDAALGKLKPATIPVSSAAGPRAASTKQAKTMPFFSPGTLAAATEAMNSRRFGAANALAPDFDLGIGLGTLGCGNRNPDDNVRVNQDCTYRRQAEEKIVYSVADPDNLVAGANDSQVGFNQCSIAFSLDSGRHWGDMLPPFRQKINNPDGELPTATDPNSHTILGGPGTFHTYDFGSDPAPAFDSSGRAFFSCVALDIFDNAAMVYVAQSRQRAQGSYFRNIDTFSRQFIVAEDNNPAVSHDKEFIAADNFPNSPNRDNVYVTWTVFKISGLSPLCFFGNFFDPMRPANACDFDQGSDPTALPNGDLEVIFNNGNTAANNPNAQQLGVHCHPTGSSPAGTAHLNCAPPTFVGSDVVVGEPQCDFGRGPEECIPGAYMRTNDFPRIAVNRTNGTSSDGGFSWSDSGTVNPDSGLDHYFPADAVANNSGGDDSRRGDRVGDSYFRTERVPNENTTPSGGFAPGQPGVQQGNSDYVLAGGTGLNLPYTFQVVSPVFPPPDGIQAGFNGDYSGLTINKGTEAHPIWSDTRNRDPFSPINGVVHDEDVFTDNLSLPNGRRRPQVGQVGQGSGGRSEE